MHCVGVLSVNHSIIGGKMLFIYKSPCFPDQDMANGKHIGKAKKPSNFPDSGLPQKRRIKPHDIKSIPVVPFAERRILFCADIHNPNLPSGSNKPLYRFPERRGANIMPFSETGKRKKKKILHYFSSKSETI